MITNKLICIVARTAAGKDTLAKYLTDKHRLRPVVSWTTRPKRPTETDCVEHKFITDQEADYMLNRGNYPIVAYTQIGDYRYWATKDDVDMADYYIIDPIGLQELDDHYPELDRIVVYLTSNEDTRRQRAISRGNTAEEVNARMSAEDKQFTDFEATNLAQFTYSNDKTVEDLHNFADTIVEYYLHKRGVSSE